IALAEAKKLNAVVITESPGFTPAATRASQRASVPDAQPTASAAPVSAAISCSSASTSGPRMKLCESHTRVIAASTSSRMPSYWRRKSRSGTERGTDPVAVLRRDGIVSFTGIKILAGAVTKSNRGVRRDRGGRNANALFAGNVCLPGYLCVFIELSAIHIRENV